MYTLPKGLDEYLRKVVTAALERWVSEGAIGIDLGILGVARAGLR